ncbi:MAG: hypothetical protein AAFX05_11985 [Planctomycetota bacterium]
MRTEQLDALVTKLMAHETATLSDDERTLIASALMALATTETLAARQGMLLTSYGEDISALEQNSRDALLRLAERLRVPPAAMYDAADAEAARQELLQDIEQASDVRAILRAALSLVSRLVVLAA